MITLFTPQHELRAPEYELFRGERVPCFESFPKAAFVLQELTARRHLSALAAAGSKPH